MSLNTTMLRYVVNIIFLIKCDHWVSVISCSCAVQLPLTLTIKLILKFCRMVQLCKETCLYKSECVNSSLKVHIEDEFL